jgi:3-deoxy-manno-octulosonate cytidylyltransferase (CMP-KDO synthetase)
MANPIVLIPARMNATRLPGKPLADIHGAPMIVHVLRRATEADVGPVWVATDDRRVMEAVASAGGKAIMTRSDHPSGSDRIFEALGAVDADGVHDVVINIQGDLPTIECSVVRACLAPLAERTVDIATLATPITREQEKDDPNVVKVIVTELDPTRFRALYFTRARAPWGDGRLLHHIGLYAYRRDSLRRFVASSPSPLERREKLEQLRALEAGMRIDVALVDTAPLGVDAPEDLERARVMLAPGKHT